MERLLHCAGWRALPDVPGPSSRTPRTPASAQIRGGSLRDRYLQCALGKADFRRRRKTNVRRHTESARTHSRTLRSLLRVLSPRTSRGHRAFARQGARSTQDRGIERLRYLTLRTVRVGDASRARRRHHRSDLSASGRAEACAAGRTGRSHGREARCGFSIGRRCIHG